MSTPVKLVETSDGYFAVEPKPSAEELRAYYRDQYYNAPGEQSQYGHVYTAEELAHKRLPAAEIEHIVGTGKRSLFEVGFGEGFVLDYFDAKGWRVGGIDFSDTAIKKFFPRLVPALQFGDLFDLLEKSARAGSSHDVLVCNHVLEHVVDPEQLLRGLRGLVAPGGVLRIQVPNDGSWLHREVVARNLARPDFWVRAPEHLSYFTAEPLAQLLQRCGWRIVDLLADFPIDMFLLNPSSCYTSDSRLGRNCHFARVAFEMALWRQSISKLADFRRGCARAGVGRNLVVYATPGTPTTG